MPKFGPQWTPEEDALLREAWASGGIRAARAAIPERSERAIYLRALRVVGAVRCRPWSERDIRRLCAMWVASYTLPWLARKLGRTEIAVYRMAERLGLGVGCPQGYEYLSAAARRAGCSRKQLRAALASYRDPAPRGERLAKEFAPLSLSPRARARNVLVEPDTVDAAVAQWVRA